MVRFGRSIADTRTAGATCRPIAFNLNAPREQDRPQSRPSPEMSSINADGGIQPGLKHNPKVCKGSTEQRKRTEPWAYTHTHTALVSGALRIKYMYAVFAKVQMKLIGVGTV